MTPEFEKFKHPPIKEAVFILNFASPVPTDKLNSLTNNSALKAKYPFFQKSIQNNFKFNNSAKSQSASIENLLDGYVFKTSEHSPEWILQTKRNYFSLHKVESYNCWEDLIIELKSIFEILAVVFGNELTLKEVAIRYINHIPIQPDQNLKSWFKLLPAEIEGIPISYNKFFQQISIHENDLNGVVIQSVLEINKLLNFVIDVRVSKVIENQTVSSDELDKLFSDIRNLKNNIFFNIITEELKPLFR